MTVKIPTWLRREVVLVGGVALGAVETAVASGSTLQVALQGAAPIVLAAVVRQLVPSTTTTKEDPMADLTALKQAASDLANAVAAVEAHVTTLKTESTPQADVDAVTSQVSSVTQQLTAVSTA
jgi:hypothetical protein